MMPEMDGLEFCEAIRGNFQTSHIPIILLTALVNEEAKYRGIDRGADEYLLKPFKINYLELRVSKLLESRKQLREAFSGPYELNPAEVTVTNLDEVFLTELLEKLEAFIPEADFSINKLEAEMGMSHANFYRKVKALTNLSGKEILQSLRMKRALHLFKNEPGLRVSEVAYMVGFSNPKYFSRCFKEAHQVTPSQVKARVEF
jgi:AraC-like DNA-binding protein